MAKGNFIEYVVSDNPNAFPDGDVHSDGFFYEVFDGSGTYVWKKSTKPITLHFTQTSGAWGTPITLQVTSSEIDVNTLTGEDFVGVKGTCGSYTYEFTSATKFIGLTYTSPIEYSYSNGVITIQGTISSVVTWSDYTKEGQFLDYIVSDSETAYPDGGEQAGYWYEKVVEGIPSPAGFTKVTVDTFTPTSNQRLQTTTIEHSHGSIPTLCVVIGNPLTTSNVPLQVGAINGSKKYGIMLGESTGYWKSGAVLTANNFRFNETYGFNFIAGVKYTVICMS